MNKVIAGIGLAVCLAVAAPSALARVDAQAATQAPVSVQLLAINDYHGNIEPPGGTFFGQPAGGAEYIATHIAALKAQIASSASRSRRTRWPGPSASDFISYRALLSEVTLVACPAR